MADDLVERLREEEWRPIPGYIGRYEASNRGRIRSLPRRGARGRLKKQYIRAGYWTTKLGKNETGLVHRLVLSAFVGPCPLGMECCHNDGNRLNNEVSNLRWDTRKANAQDRVSHGGSTKADAARRVLSTEQAAYVRANYRIIKQADLAAMMQCSRATIQRIHSGERYA